MTRRTPTAVLISGRGSNMTALLNAASDPAYPAQITLVLSNRPDAAGLNTARDYGVEAICVDHAGFAGRESFEAALNEVLQARDIELVALAGFMRVLTSQFTLGWSGRLINIHPSLLPSFKGLHTHERAIDAGVAMHGCTVHFVNEGVDTGAIIGQAAVPVLHGDTHERLAERVLAAEHRLYPLCLAHVARGHVVLENGRTRWITPPAIDCSSGYLLNPPL